MEAADIGDSSGSHRIIQAGPSPRLCVAGACAHKQRVSLYKSAIQSWSFRSPTCLWNSINQTWGFKCNHRGAKNPRTTHPAQAQQAAECVRLGPRAGPHLRASAKEGRGCWRPRFWAFSSTFSQLDLWHRKPKWKNHRGKATGVKKKKRQSLQKNVAKENETETRTSNCSD